jgi:FkbM family methyltransferase
MIQELATRYGTMFVPDTDNCQYEWLVNTGASPEDEYISLVCDLLDERPKGIALDIGANFGCWTLPLTKQALHVTAFEPQRCCANLLLGSLRASGIENAAVINMAVDSQDGWAAIPQLDLQADNNFGGVSLHNSWPQCSTLQVRKVALDNFLSVDHISFVKIDVEGNELNVLKGAHKMIARCRPVLFVEAVHEHTDIDALGDYILSLGYGIDCQGPNFLCVPA